MIIACLSTPALQDQPLLASSLQTAHNLSVLPALVENLLGELCDKLVADRVAAAFDMAALAKLVGQKGAPPLLLRCLSLPPYPQEC